MINLIRILDFPLFYKQIFKITMMLYENFPVQNLNGKEKKYIIQGRKVHNVLEQVSDILSHLLEDLNYIYRANGINYLVQNYHNTLIRLLTPFQLLTHFGIADNSDLFQSQKLSRQRTQYRQNQRDQFKKLSPDLKFTPSPFQQDNREGQKVIKSKKANKRYYYRDRSKPLLDQDIEDQLVEWTMKKIMENKKVRRKDIAQKALKLNANQNGFGGSMGWVRRFLERHPQLQIQLKKATLLRINRKSNSKKVQQSSDNDSQNNFDFEQIKNIQEQNSLEKQKFYKDQDQVQQSKAPQTKQLQNDQCQLYYSRSSKQRKNNYNDLKNHYYQPQKKSQQVQQVNNDIGVIKSQKYIQYLNHHKNWNSYRRNIKWDQK